MSASDASMVADDEVASRSPASSETWRRVIDGETTESGLWLSSGQPCGFRSGEPWFVHRALGLFAIRADRCYNGVSAACSWRAPPEHPNRARIEKAVQSTRFV